MPRATGPAAPRHPSMPQELGTRYADALRQLDSLWPGALGRWNQKEATKRYHELQRATIGACEHYRTWLSEYERLDDDVAKSRKSMKTAAKAARSLVGWIEAQGNEANDAIVKALTYAQINITPWSADPVDRVNTWLRFKTDGVSSRNSTLAVLDAAIEARAKMRRLEEAPATPSPDPAPERLLCRLLTTMAAEIEDRCKGPVWNASLNMTGVLIPKAMLGAEGRRIEPSTLLAVSLEAIFRRFTADGRARGEWAHQPLPIDGEPCWRIVADFVQKAFESEHDEEACRKAAEKFRKSNPGARY